MRTLITSVMLSLIAALFVTGCGGGSSSGSVALLIGDAPLRIENVDITAVDVSISRIELRGGGSEDSAVTIFDNAAEPVNVDLLSLANLPLDSLRAINPVNVPEGHYGMMRITLAAASITLAENPTPVELTVPSGGFNIPIDLTITASSTETLLVDFNLARFVHSTGHGFQLEPNAIRISRISETGSIAGTLVPAASETLSENIYATVSVTVPGELLPLTTSVEIAPGQTGAFVLNGIPAGAYDVTITLEYASQTPQTMTVTGVTVEEGIQNNLGNVDLPTMTP